MEYAVNQKITKDRKTIRICKRYSECVTYYLAPQISAGSVYVIKQVEFETGNRMNDVIAQAVQRSNLAATRARQLKEPCMKRFQTLHNGTVYEDDITLLSAVNQMYQDIWKNSTKNAKKQIWATKKNKKIEQGPPIDGDLFILSTAAKLAETCDVELLTLDHDFIIFKDEIEEKFHVRIKDAGTIPNP